MSFDKTEYAAYRAAGLRAQGSFTFSKRGFSTGTVPETGNKPVSKKALRKNTKRARKAAVN